MYVLYYVSADNEHPDSPWSVYSEQYAFESDDTPIEGSTEHVSTHPGGEWVARLEAKRLQTNRPSYKELVRRVATLRGMLVTAEETRGQLVAELDFERARSEERRVELVEAYSRLGQIEAQG